jgi:hypothetical protein
VAPIFAALIIINRTYYLSSSHLLSSFLSLLSNQTQPAEEGYDPRRSRVSDDTMETWRTAQVTGDLTEVPGIGPSTAAKLKDCDDPAEQITNTFQLFGKFLMLKGPDTEDNKVEPIEHTQKFWYFLKNRGVQAHRSAIVKAIATKSATFFNSIYDANDFEDDDDDDEDEE